MAERRLLPPLPDAVTPSTYQVAPGGLVGNYGDFARLRIHPAQIPFSQSPTLIEISDAFTLDAALTLGILRFTSTVTLTTAPPNPMALLFQASSTFIGNPSGASIAFTPFTVLAATPTFLPAAGKQILTARYRGMNASPILADAPVAGSTASFLIGMLYGPSVGTNWTATDLQGIKATNPGGAGVITTYALIDADDITRATTNMIIRSRGATAHSRHVGALMLGSDVTPNTKLDILGAIATRAGNVAVVNGVNDNVAIGDLSYVRLTGPTLAFSLSSMASPFDGKRVVIQNTTAQAMTLTHEAATGTAANRFHMSNAANIVTVGEGWVEVIYDATLARWLPIGLGSL